MNSFRNHRVVIASLFLPTTAILGESVSSTPDQHIREPQAVSVPAVALRLGEKPKSRQSSFTGSITGPLKSIVEDLRDRVSIRANQCSR